MYPFFIVKEWTMSALETLNTIIKVVAQIVPLVGGHAMSKKMNQRYDWLLEHELFPTVVFACIVFNAVKDVWKAVLITLALAAFEAVVDLFTDASRCQPKATTQPARTTR